MLPAVNRSMRRWPQGRGAGTLFRAKNLLMQRPNGQPALASGAEDWCPCPVAAHPAGGVGTTREYMIITTTAVVLYDNTSPLVPESTGEAGGFGHLPVTLSLQVVIQASPAVRLRGANKQYRPAEFLSGGYASDRNLTRLLPRPAANSQKRPVPPEGLSRQARSAEREPVPRNPPSWRPRRAAGQRLRHFAPAPAPANLPQCAIHPRDWRLFPSASREKGSSPPRTS